MFTSSIILIIRRFLAVFFDLFFILTASIFIILAQTSLNLPFLFNLEIEFLIFLLLYFALSEFYNNGQTIGKYLFKIKRVQSNGKKLQLYNSFLRSSILFLFPVLGILSSELYDVIFITENVSSTTPSISDIIIFFPVIVIPTSIILSGGSSSLIDSISSTCVIRYKEINIINKRSSWIYSVIISILLLIPYYYIQKSTLTEFGNYENREVTGEVEGSSIFGFGVDYSLNFSNYILSYYINNVDNYINDGANLVMTQFNKNYHKFSFTKSPIKIVPEIIPDSLITFAYVINLDINCTLDGISSNILMAGIASLINDYIQSTVPLDKDINILVTVNRKINIPLYFCKIYFELKNVGSYEIIDRKIICDGIYESDNNKNIGIAILFSK